MSDNKVAFKSIKHGSTSKCMQATVNAIKDELKLMQDQIVSISLHDTKVHHGDMEAVVFYRTQSTVDNSEPTESLQYNLIVRDEDTYWSKINQEILLNCNSPGKQTIAIGSTFRNVGEEKISCSFQIDGRQSQVHEKLFQSRESWEELIQETKEWMNTYITPYEFAGMVIYEEEHPLMEREQ